MKNVVISFCLFGALLCIGACHERRAGPLERAGERMDEIKDNAEEGKPLLHKKGSLEKAGEAVDDAISGNDRR